MFAISQFITLLWYCFCLPDLFKITSSMFVSVCSMGQYKCPEGNCIMAEWLCDGEWDCHNGTDEQLCRKFINIQLITLLFNLLIYS